MRDRRICAWCAPSWLVPDRGVPVICDACLRRVNELGAVGGWPLGVPVTTSRRVSR